MDGYMVVDALVNDDNEDVNSVLTKILSRKACWITGNRGDFSLVDLGHTVQQRTQVTFWYFFNFFP